MTTEQPDYQLGCAPQGQRPECRSVGESGGRVPSTCYKPQMHLNSPTTRHFTDWGEGFPFLKNKKKNKKH